MSGHSNISPSNIMPKLPTSNIRPQPHHSQTILPFSRMAKLFIELMIMRPADVAKGPLLLIKVGVQREIERGYCKNLALLWLISCRFPAAVTLTLVCHKTDRECVYGRWTSNVVFMPASEMVRLSFLFLNCARNQAISKIIRQYCTKLQVSKKSSYNWHAKRTTPKRNLAPAFMQRCSKYDNAWFL